MKHQSKDIKSTLCQQGINFGSWNWYKVDERLIICWGWCIIDVSICDSYSFTPLYIVDKTLIICWGWYIIDVSICDSYSFTQLYSFTICCPQQGHVCISMESKWQHFLMNTVSFCTHPLTHVRWGRSVCCRTLCSRRSSVGASDVFLWRWSISIHMELRQRAGRMSRGQVRTCRASRCSWVAVLQPPNINETRTSRSRSTFHQF